MAEAVVDENRELYERLRRCATSAWVRCVALMQDRGTLGQLLETFVSQEPRREASWHEEEIRFCHYRDKDRVEVDLVLERGAGKLAAVGVTAEPAHYDLVACLYVHVASPVEDMVEQGATNRASRFNQPWKDPT